MLGFRAKQARTCGRPSTRRALDAGLGCWVGGEGRGDGAEDDVSNSVGRRGLALADALCRSLWIASSARSVPWLNCRVVLVALSVLHGFVDCVEDALLSELVEQAGAPGHLDYGLAGVGDREVDSC
jgi:hypothetical protein